MFEDATPKVAEEHQCGCRTCRHKHEELATLWVYTHELEQKLKDTEESLQATIFVVEHLQGQKKRARAQVLNGNGFMEDTTEAELDLESERESRFGKRMRRELIASQ